MKFSSGVSKKFFDRKDLCISEGQVRTVDDEPDVRRRIKLTLKKADFDVVEAEDREAGIQAIQSGDNPLAVKTSICDMQMPKIHGMEAVAYFRQ